MSMNDNQYDFALLMDYQHVLRSKSDPNLREQKSNETFPKTQQTQDINPVSGFISTACIESYPGSIMPLTSGKVLEMLYKSL